jgi:hypothetical protein
MKTKAWWNIGPCSTQTLLAEMETQGVDSSLLIIVERFINNPVTFPGDQGFDDRMAYERKQITKQRDALGEHSPTLLH